MSTIVNVGGREFEYVEAHYLPIYELEETMGSSKHYVKKKPIIDPLSDFNGKRD